MKRLVVGVFVSAFAIVGIAPAASAATSGAGSTKVVKVIDWDAPPADGGATTNRIDWD